LETAGATAERRSGIPDIVARITTELFNPPWVGIGVLGAVAAHSTDGFGQFIQWWAIAAFFASLLPLGFLIQALRRGNVSDWYVTRANERLVPFSVAAVSFGAAAVLMIVLSAPVELLAVTLAGMAGLFVAIALTPKWKLSMHTGSISGAVVVLAMTFGPWALLSIPVIPLVGWARTRVAHHTFGQVVVGGVIGAIVATVVFLAVTRLA
jgi:hypothetical protein